MKQRVAGVVRCEDDAAKRVDSGKRVDRGNGVSGGQRPRWATTAGGCGGRLRRATATGNCAERLRRATAAGGCDERHATAPGDCARRLPWAAATGGSSELQTTATGDGSGGNSRHSPAADQHARQLATHRRARTRTLHTIHHRSSGLRTPSPPRFNTCVYTIVVLTSA